ncbi:hypothetical protein E8L99_19095 [Phreatobacter aquaticus]|uniref:Oxidoreductase molybdopterin-binding domain-containing protein n=1 Tax=Phreatobacter aquaticus TaxID=2570229 RepID=A0A4D7QRZ9_9HYPH|nr:hypothetical protein [Phreatobacter aquaticus]QCK87707.1 hypothetical protein E8L99_19095 [Phreatobacter aquaticus]
MRRALSALTIMLALALAAPATAQTLSLVGIADQPIMLDIAAIEALGTTEITDSREVSGATGTERISIVYRGVELAKLLEAQGIARLDRHGLRAATIMITAKDGYRASFSWGELFITSGGSRVLLITGENGRANPAREGAFSLRAFADLRPGPRHVRDVAEIRVVLPR